MTTRREALRLVGLAAAGGLLFGGMGCRRMRGQALDTLRLWHIWDGERAIFHSAMMDRFHDLHPEVVVESRQIPARYLRNEFLLAMESDSLPDVFMVNSSWIISRRITSALAPLGGHVQGEGDDLSGILRKRDHERCLVDGKLMALPLVSAQGGGMLFVSAELVASVGMGDVMIPGSWSEFCEYSAELVGRLNPDGVLRRVALDPFSPQEGSYFQSLGIGLGLPFISRDGTQSMLNDPDMEQLLVATDQYVERVYKRFGGLRALLRWRASAGNTDNFSSVHPFVSKRQAFSISGVSLLGSYLSLMPASALRVAPVPGLRGPVGGIAAHGWAYAMNARSRNLGKAWKLLRFLTIDERGNGRFCLDQKRPCPIVAVNRSPEYSKLGEAWTGCCSAMDLDVPYPYAVEVSVVREWLSSYPYMLMRGDSHAVILKSFHRDLQSRLDILVGEGVA